eukprot:403366036
MLRLDRNHLQQLNTIDDSQTPSKFMRDSLTGWRQETFGKDSVLSNGQMQRLQHRKSLSINHSSQTVQIGKDETLQNYDNSFKKHARNLSIEMQNMQIDEGLETQEQNPQQNEDQFHRIIEIQISIQEYEANNLDNKKLSQENIIKPKLHDFNYEKPQDQSQERLKNQIESNIKAYQRLVKSRSRVHQSLAMQQQTEKPSITYLHLDPNFLLQKSNDKEPTTSKQSANLAHYQFSESEQNQGTSYSKHANSFDFRNIPKTQTKKRKETIKSFQSSINKVNITQSDQNKSGVMVLKQCEQQYTNDKSIKQDQQKIMKQGSLDQVYKSTINLGTPFALSQEETVVPLTHVKKDQSQITVHDLMLMKGAFIPGKTKLLTSAKVQNNIDQYQMSSQKLQNKSIDQEKHLQSPNKKKYLKGQLELRIYVETVIIQANQS